MWISWPKYLRLSQIGNSHQQPQILVRETKIRTLVASVWFALCFLENVLPGGYACHIHKQRRESSQQTGSHLLFRGMARC